MKSFEAHDGQRLNAESRTMRLFHLLKLASFRTLPETACGRSHKFVRQSLAWCLTGLMLVANVSAQVPRGFARPMSVKSSEPVNPRHDAESDNVQQVAKWNAGRRGETAGVPSVGAKGKERTTAELLKAQAQTPDSNKTWLKLKHEVSRRGDAHHAPKVMSVGAASDLSITALPRPLNFPVEPLAPLAPQTIGTNFKGAALADSGRFPPDTAGAVGPSQFLVFVNGRIRTFNKATGVADGVLNVTSDTFFASVMTPPPTAQHVTFTANPQVRYDRLSGRWILLCIDVPLNVNTGLDTPNRILIAVSDAASAGVISAGTVWTYYFVQQNTVGGGNTNQFFEYPSLGVDNNALYVGGNTFSTTTNAFVDSTAFVIRKSSILSGGPVVVTAFRGLASISPIVDGPFQPRGVDNYDPSANEGYFIGISPSVFGRLVMRRISDPGGTPTISANILITVPATSFPITVDHLGDTGGTNGNLAAHDDRLWEAHIRNGKLWTSHNIAVNSAGVATTSDAQRRDAVRWYELDVPVGTGTPTVVQSGTIFDNAATVAAARQFFIPSVMVSGQGHAAFGFTTAGTPYRIDAATTGRLATDPLGTTQAVELYTASTTAYNPPADPGGAGGRRWGAYSYTSLDPLDDMTMWTIQEYCDATNSWGVQVAKLIAPPPATPSSVATLNGNTVPQGQANYFITLNGTQINGSGFYDPGADLAPPALPFNHVNVTINGVGAPTVNSVGFVDPTTLTVAVNSSAALPGSYTVTVTNPDGQAVTSAAPILTVSAPIAQTYNISGQVTEGGNGLGGVTMTLSGSQAGMVMTDVNGQYGFSVAAGGNYTVTPTKINYTFNPPSQTFNNLNSDQTANFIALPAGGLNALQSWTTTANSGVTEDESNPVRPTYTNFTASANPGSPAGTYVLRYNISALGTLSTPGAVSTRLRVRFRDDGAGSQVVVAIVRASIFGGASTLGTLFDSNAYTPGSGFQTQEIVMPALTFDFTQNLYWLEVRLIKADDLNQPGFGSAQINQQ